NRQSPTGGNRTFLIESTPERINYPPDHSVARRNVHDPPGPLDLCASTHMVARAQQDDSNLVLVEVECNSIEVLGKFDQFIITDAWQTRHRCDARRNGRDCADFLRGKAREECLP